jgi:hypothetical protein
MCWKSAGRQAVARKLVVVTDRGNKHLQGLKKPPKQRSYKHTHMHKKDEIFISVRLLHENSFPFLSFLLSNFPCANDTQAS